MGFAPIKWPLSFESQAGCYLPSLCRGEGQGRGGERGGKKGEGRKGEALKNGRYSVGLER